MEGEVTLKKHTNIVLNIVSIVIAVAFLFPLYWVVISSLKGDAEIFKNPPTFFPETISFSAYIAQFSSEYSIFRGFFNSCIIAFSTMCIVVLLAIPAAYGLARYKIKGKKVFVHAFLVTQMLPATLLLTPMFILYGKMHILNTYIAPIISDATISIPFIVLILRTYFLSIPKDIEESAKIDGCTTIQAFIKIIIPISYPGIIMGAVFSFLYAWGDLAYSLTFLNKQAMRPMTSGIYNFMGEYGTQWNQVMAFGTITIIPVTLIFIFLQKYIVGGLTSGAVKE